LFVDPELVKSVEVVRGPTSSLYSAGALGGVIAAQTITANDILASDRTEGVRLNHGYQSANDEYKVGAFGVVRSAEGKIDVASQLTYRDLASLPSLATIRQKRRAFRQMPTTLARHVTSHAQRRRFEGETRWRSTINMHG